MEKIKSFLKALNRFSPIVKQLEQEPKKSAYIFEAFFAYTMELNKIELNYEVKVNPENKSTVDFIHEHEHGTLAFELVSPDMSEELKKETAPLNNHDQFGIWEANLDSRHNNQFLRPEALTFRMQEKLLEKTKKFPEPSDRFFSLIAVDCTNFHFEHIDSYDCQQIMYGCTTEPCFLEFWNGERIKGLLENGFKKHDAEKFQKRVSGVIFFPSLAANMFDKFFFVPNFRRSKIHRTALEKALGLIPIFKKPKMTIIRISLINV